MMELPQTFVERLHALGVSETPRILVVRISEQKLFFFEKGQLKAEYPISTASKGAGEQQNSFQTPRGLHRIQQKIGAGLPSGAIFENREFKNQIWVPSPMPVSVNLDAEHSAEGTGGSKEAASAPDLITSRILWLEGLEPGSNHGMDGQGRVVDSYQRYIYIHGTNQEHLMGKPSSFGCVRMTNEGVIRLFDQVKVGDLVWVEE